MNTKAECKRYKGRVWLNGEIGKNGNICVDTGHEELMVIAYKPVITEENIVSAIEAMGWIPERWFEEETEEREPDSMDFEVWYKIPRSNLRARRIAAFHCRFNAEDFIESHNEPMRSNFFLKVVGESNFYPNEIF